MTYIDSIPFQYIGKGEQCVIKTKLALSTKKSTEATAILTAAPAGGPERWAAWSR